MYNFGRNPNQFLRKNVNICEKKKEEKCPYDNVVLYFRII
jgi:hypothetical protein